MKGPLGPSILIGFVQVQAPSGRWQPSEARADRSRVKATSAAMKAMTAGEGYDNRGYGREGEREYGEGPPPGWRSYNERPYGWQERGRPLRGFIGLSIGDDCLEHLNALL
jgi:hypothetical protein